MTFDEGDVLNGIRAPKRIIGWSIYNLEARTIELEEAWISGFEKQYGIPVKKLIDIHNSCLRGGRNRVPANREKYMSSELEKERIRLSRAQLEEILKRLRSHHHWHASQLDT
jgi:hypothetical protein